MRLNRLLAGAVMLVGCGEEMMTSETSQSLSTPHFEATVSGNAWTGTPAHAEIMGRNYLLGFGAGAALIIVIDASQAGIYKCDLGSPIAITFQENGKAANATNGMGTCRIEISQFGAVGQPIDGQFEASLVSPSNGSTVAVTRGSFSVTRAP